MQNNGPDADYVCLLDRGSFFSAGSNPEMESTCILVAALDQHIKLPLF